MLLRLMASLALGRRAHGFSDGDGFEVPFLATTEHRCSIECPNQTSHLFAAFYVLRVVQRCSFSKYLDSDR